MTPETCPRCGAPPSYRTEKSACYTCLSSFHRVNGVEYFTEPTACLYRQRDQLLQKVQRLEEAGDAVVAVLRESEDQDFCDWIDKAYDAESKWNQAKEAKP